METNVGTIDQRVRIAGFILAAIFYFRPQGSEMISIVAGILVIYFFMTAVAQYCLIWDILGISTLKWKPLRKW